MFIALFGSAVTHVVLCVSSCVMYCLTVVCVCVCVLCSSGTADRRIASAALQWCEAEKVFAPCFFFLSLCPPHIPPPLPLNGTHGSLKRLPVCPSVRFSRSVFFSFLLLLFSSSGSIRAGSHDRRSICAPSLIGVFEC